MTKLTAIVSGFLLISLSLFSGAVPAFAHADLVSTTPVDGAALKSAPQSLTLSFNSTLLDEMVEVAVSNSDGELVSGVVAESAGTDAVAPWPADLPGDTYKVAYRIVSQDGHPVTGSFSFSYPDPETVTAEPTQDTTAEPEVTTMDDPTAEPETAAPETATPLVVEESPSDSESMLVWVLGFLALALVVAGYFIWRNRST
ncbi:MAG: copper resistance protein CopC [Candidatus Nanopelagicales bacterium]|jgi:methionine-rich copper-binding protein CopC|nr:copper resistance protein CopC [Candidatus Nanopelagicales bacterium]